MENKITVCLSFPSYSELELFKFIKKADATLITFERS